MSSLLRCQAVVPFVLVLAAAAAPAQPLLPNGGFEEGLAGWGALWTRDAGAGSAAIDRRERHGGRQAVRVEHTGERDWSLGSSLTLAVQPGDVYDLSAWVRVQGRGSATLGVVTRDGGGTALAWAWGGRTVRATGGWVEVRSRFVVPPGVTTIWPRLIGDGPATIWCDDVVLARQEPLAVDRDLPARLVIRNDALEATFRTRDAAFELRDLRGGRAWSQAGSGLMVLRASAGGATMALRLLDPGTMREIAVEARLADAAPEMRLSLRASGEMHEPVAWPPPFASSPGDLLILPVNEGISYPVDDASLPAMRYHLYGGHGLCMPWYGATDGGGAGAGWMALIETPDDAAVALPRRDGRLVLAPSWEPQKRAFGPDRVIRFVLVDRGGYVAMAKRYRAYARETGLLRTLAEKRRSVPAVDLLVGAVNVWCWERDAPALARELRGSGIERILWSAARPPDELAALNAMGVLTSRYDIYQDAMDPAQYPRLRWIQSDWTSDAWKNDDLLIGADGDWVRGWEVETKQGGRIPCGVLCDRQAVAYARRRIPAELATHPYRSRFIDTTTASPWRECWHPAHPMTRTESRGFKMDLLRYVSEECGLVTGSETGHDAAVPWVHYFEGMMSLGPYRVPDAGRDMARVLDEVPDRVATFQTGHRYRLPLWELVYHDCVVAQWYWGDYNNKLPALWDRRDLWNALYGTPPMFMLDRKSWQARHDRFVQSYRATAPVARATGYSEMVTHAWLTPDHAVQRTTFAGGIVVTVNFGESPFTLPDGRILAPLQRLVDGLPAL
jgi:hypothetical protein